MKSRSTRDPGFMNPTPSVDGYEVKPPNRRVIKEMLKERLIIRYNKKIVPRFFSLALNDIIIYIVLPYIVSM